MLQPRRFQDDFAWQQQHLPMVIRAVAPLVILEAPAFDDRRRAADLVLLKRGDLSIAVRLRQADVFARYGDEFTVRDRRPSGVETELAKFMRGLGDYLCYGFVAPGGDHLMAWTLGDLDVFRRWYGERAIGLPPGATPGRHRVNSDGTAFQAFKFTDLPPEFVVGDYIDRGNGTAAMPRWRLGPNAPARARLVVGQRMLPGFASLFDLDETTTP